MLKDNDGAKEDQVKAQIRSDFIAFLLFLTRFSLAWEQAVSHEWVLCSCHCGTGMCSSLSLTFSTCAGGPALALTAIQEQLTVIPSFCLREVSSALLLLPLRSSQMTLKTDPRS